MKKLLSILLAVILIFLLAACQTSSEPMRTNPPGSNGPSKPDPMEASAPEIEETTKNDHDHTLAETPQTVDNPVTGYCGNTMTTIVLNDQEYTFMGSDSVNLTDIVINLKYDPDQVCRCAPEFTVKTEFGEAYGVNLSQGYARCDQGQTDLTPEQVELIRQILDNQT